MIRIGSCDISEWAKLIPSTRNDCASPGFSLTTCFRVVCERLELVPVSSCIEGTLRLLAQ